VNLATCAFDSTSLRILDRRKGDERHPPARLFLVALGSGKRLPVRVTVGGHCYRTTVASMDGRFFVPLNADNRSAAGVAAGDEVDVEIATDNAPRKIIVPDDLAEALAGDLTAAAFFDGLSYTHRKEWVRWIEDAKKADTRASRL